MTDLELLKNYRKVAVKGAVHLIQKDSFKTVKN